MLIIGERINSTRESIGRAIQLRDEAFVQEEARLQLQAGAQMLDINCGSLPLEDEPEALEWLVTTIQKVHNVPLCIDSPNPAALARALAAHRGKAMINSISAEEKKFRDVLALLKAHNSSVVALCLDDSGLPKGCERTTKIAQRLVNNLLNAGIPLDDIYIDPLVRSISTSPEAALLVLKSTETILKMFPGIHVIFGLSNVSHGLPERKHINRAFLVLSLKCGLDAVIIDPTDRTTMALIYATRAILGHDEYCLQYIQAYRQGKLS